MGDGSAGAMLFAWIADDGAKGAEIMLRREAEAEELDEVERLGSLGRLVGDDGADVIGISVMLSLGSSVGAT